MLSLILIIIVRQIQGNFYLQWKDIYSIYSDGSPYVV